jgi:hypothetical protein
VELPIRSDLKYVREQPFCAMSDRFGDKHQVEWSRVGWASSAVSHCEVPGRAQQTRVNHWRRRVVVHSRVSERRPATSRLIQWNLAAGKLQE